jgi:cystathionine gamma-synthase
MSGDPFTQAIHGDSFVEDGIDVAPPIHVTSTYDRSEQSEMVYRRDRHVTTERLEAVLGALEGGHAVCYPSGLAATGAVLRHLKPDRVYLSPDVYHGTRWQMSEEAPWELIDDMGRAGEGDVIWFETPSNPKALIIDIAEVTAAAAESGVRVVVDSTFATPILQHPLALGADFVMHSTTKYIGGHSDAMGGVIVAPDEETAAALRQARRRDGVIPGSLDAWLTLRGVRTLPLRIERQCRSAIEIASFLEGRVATVWHPSLTSHPGHEVWERQMTLPGAIIAFEMETQEAAGAVLAGLRVISNATSLGGVESLIEHRLQVNPDAPPELLRLSVGLEAPADLIADLEQAIDSS